ncbi:hypothetical protein LBMAG42_09140 [Deltaproteobacteria bacterium]|nr:hypothetical protein LBMAG42_09140 [Deltaproteobacteria bacterium]
MSLLLLSLFACGLRDAGSEFGEDAIPQEDQLLVNLPEASDAAKSPEDPEAWAIYYEQTREITTSVNGVIKFVLGTTWLVVSTQEPTWADEEAHKAMWGPYEGESALDPVSTGVYAQKNDDGTYTWSVFQVPNGGTVEEDAVNIVVGNVDAGATREAASGAFTIDFTAANALDPAQNLVGTFNTEYAYDAEGVSALVTTENYGFEDFPHWNAAYDYDEAYEGGGEMDFAYASDLNASGVEEIVTHKSRWDADGQGRGDATVLDGDLSVESVTASECWGTDFHTSYWVDNFDLYDDVGVESDCAYIGASYADEASFSSAD